MAWMIVQEDVEIRGLGINYIGSDWIRITFAPQDQEGVTDSGSEIVYREDKPALMNLINIYALLADKSTQEIEQMYAGKGLASTRGSRTRGRVTDFKGDLAEVMSRIPDPFQERMAGFSDEKVLEILKGRKLKKCGRRPRKIG